MALLRGLKEISAYLRVSEGTASKYIKYRGLPVVRSHRKGGLPLFLTSPTLIDQWILAEDKIRRERLKAG